MSEENAVLPVEERPAWSRTGGKYAGNGTGNADGNDIAPEMDPAGLVPTGSVRAMKRTKNRGRARGQCPRTLITRVSLSPPPPPSRPRPARAEPPASSVRDRDEQLLGGNAGRSGRIDPRSRVKRAKRPPKSVAPAKRVAHPDHSNGASDSYGKRSSISFAAVAAPTRSLPCLLYTSDAADE